MPRFLGAIRCAVRIPREVKVGAFVVAGLLGGGLIVFLIGDTRRAFESKDRYYVVFDDVQGLSRGSPVRMGGVDIGQVAGVAYSEDVNDSHLRVSLDVVRSEARRIREDSVATIGAKGLLGDKMVVIRIGSTGKKPLPAGSTLPSEQPTDLSAMAEKLGQIGEKAEAVMTNLEKTTQTLADPELQADFRNAVRSLSHILRTVDEGDGYVSRLLRDPKEADQISKSVANLERATAELDHTLAGVDSVVARVNSGPGFAHDMIYGKGPTEAVAQIGHAASELAITLEGVRKGNGLAHSIVYGDDATQQLIGDLNSIAGDVKKIVADVRAGKGTLGALMVDPSVYEDLKLLLGNVERNKTLRALVRYSIQKDEKAPPVVVTDPGRASGAVRASGGK